MIQMNNQAIGKALAVLTACSLGISMVACAARSTAEQTSAQGQQTEETVEKEKTSETFGSTQMQT